MSAFAIVVVLLLGTLTTWLLLVTATLLRWRGQQGEPVYRRLADGRLQFSWSTHTAFHRALRGSTQHPTTARRRASAP